MSEISIFDLGVPEVEGKKEEPKKRVFSSAKPEVVEPKEPIKVSGDWTIHFAAETFNVSDLMDDGIPEEGVTLEDIRVELSKHFFQFTATRTVWDVDEEGKRLFPDSYGAAKGAM